MAQRNSTVPPSTTRVHFFHGDTDQPSPITPTTSSESIDLNATLVASSAESTPADPFDDESEDHWEEARVSRKKRTRPESGLTPPKRHKRMKSRNSSQAQASGAGTQIENTMINDNRSKQDTSEVSPSQGSEPVRSSRFSIVVKSNAVIKMNQLIEILRKNLPKNCFISRQDLSVQKTVALFKFSTSDATTEKAAIDAITSPNARLQLSTSYGSPLEVAPFDPSYRQTREANDLAKQVVARFIPTDYTETYIADEVEKFNREIGAKITEFRRIMTGDDRRPSQFVRVTCVDAETAATLLRDGLLIEGLKFTCETPRQRQRIERCFRCWSTEHKRNGCKEPLKCGKCGESHETNTCIAEQSQFKCCNCSGSHAVWYAGCQFNRQAAASLKDKETSSDKRKEVPQAPEQNQQEGHPPPTLPRRNQWVRASKDQPCVSNQCTREEQARAAPEVINTNQLDELKAHMDKRLAEMMAALQREIRVMHAEMSEKLREICKSIKDASEFRDDSTKSFRAIHEIVSLQQNSLKRVVTGTPVATELYTARIKKKLDEFKYRGTEPVENTQPDISADLERSKTRGETTTA